VSASRRDTACAWLRRAAWLAFGAMLVLSPLRARFDLVARPAGRLYHDYTDVLLSWNEIAALLVLALWLGSVAVRPRRVWLGPRFVALPVAVLLALAWLGTPFATDPALAAMTSLRLTLLAALALYVCNELPSPVRVVAPVALMVAVQSAVGIGQVMAQRSLGLGGLGEYTLAPNLAVSVVTAGDGTRYLRAYGLADHPNILGGLLVAGVLLVGGLASLRRPRERPLLLAVCLLGVAAILVTFSRGAWIALLAGLAVSAAMLVAAGRRRDLRRAALVVAAGLVVAAPLLVGYRSALAARTDPAGASATEVRSVDERAAVAGTTAHLAADHPLLGVGIGGTPEAMRLANPSFHYAYQPSSIVLLDAAAETGVAGGVAYAVLLVAPWVAMLRRRRAWTRELVAVSAALAALTIAGLFDYYTWTYPAGRIWAFVVLGLWALAWRRAVAGDAGAG